MKTVRDLGAPPNSFLVGLRRENRGMRIRIEEEQRPLSDDDTRRSSSSQRSLLVGAIRLESAGSGSLGRVLVHLLGRTFRSADELLRQLAAIDAKVGSPWRILSAESLKFESIADQDWDFEAEVFEPRRPKPQVVRPAMPVSNPSEIRELVHPRSVADKQTHASPQTQSVEQAAEQVDTPMEINAPAELKTPVWVTALVDSEIFRTRHSSLGRTAPKIADLTKLLSALDEAGNKLTANATATAMQQSPMRLRGFIAAAQRLLNIDGYQSLVFEGESSIELRTELLIQQFGLGTSYSVDSSGTDESSGHDSI